MRNPSLNLRLPPKLLKALKAEAKDTEKTIQTIIRHALQERMRRKPRGPPPDTFLEMFSKPRRKT